jgi:hypothetical protein
VSLDIQRTITISFQATAKVDTGEAANAVNLLATLFVLEASSALATGTDLVVHATRQELREMGLRIRALCRDACVSCGVFVGILLRKQGFELTWIELYAMEACWEAPVVLQRLVELEGDAVFADQSL